MLSHHKTPPIERCRLRVVVEPPAAAQAETGAATGAGTGAGTGGQPWLKGAEVQVRSMHGSHGPPSSKAWQPLKPDGTGAFEARLPPGRYLIWFRAPKLRPEHRPIELHGIGVEVTLAAMPFDQRHIRIGGQRRPCLTPAAEVTVFLEPGATGMALARVFAVADRLGLVFDPTRAEDPGVFKVAALMGLRDEPLAAPDFPGWQGAPRGGPEPMELPPAEDDDRDPADLDAFLPPDSEQFAEVKALRPEVYGGRPSLAVPLRAATPRPTPQAIATLRYFPSVIAAGASLSTDPRFPMVRHPYIDARLQPDTTPAEVLANLDAPWARLLRFAQPQRAGRHAIPGLFRVSVPTHFDETIEDIIDGMLATGLVLYAEPCLAQRGELLAGVPDVLASRQWDLGLIAVDAAQERLRNRPATTPATLARPTTVAIIDEDITHTHHAVLHADLAGQVRFFDATGRPGGHERATHNHGGKIAGLIAAIDHPGPGEGIRGVSPATVINALAVNPANFNSIAETFRAAGGLTATTAITGTDVIIFAMRIGVDPANSSQPPTPSGLPSTPWGVIPDAFRTLVTRGRNGRGCLVVLSAGNSQEAIATHNPIACSTDIIACGASDLNADGEFPGKESCPGPELTCVAPGYRNGMSASWTIAPHPIPSWPSRPLITGPVSAVDASAVNAPKVTATLTASATDLQAIPIGARVVLERNDGEQDMWRVGAIEWPSTPHNTVQLTLRRASLSKPGLLTGVSKLGISDLRRARITQPPRDVSVNGLRAIFVWLDRPLPLLKSVLVADDAASNPIELAVYAAGRIKGTNQWAALLTPVAALEDISAGMWLWESASGHVTDFGQTSAAAAICAGVGSLVLAANPALTAFEARDILATTTDRLRLEFNQPIETAFHPKLGHGRINAHRAVEAALAYNHPRDLCFDPGGLPSGGHSPETAAVFARVAPYNPSSPDPTQPVVYTSPAGLDLMHQAISASGASGYVYAVITNRLPTTGPGKPSLAAWVRFYVVTAPTGTRFEWPTHWTDNPGTPLVDLRSRLIGEVPLNPGIAPGDRRLIQMQWPAWASPIATDQRPRHLLVEVVPHDGPRNGTTIAENDNLARRLMLFTP